MADVTISGLNNLTPQGNTLLPISNGSTTGKTTIASLPVSWNSVTGKPAIPVPVAMDVLIVGGGGSGGNGFADQAGAGGGGGVINYTNYNIYPGTYYITIGAGGYSPGGSYNRSDGSNTLVFGGNPAVNFVAYGGGAGAAQRGQRGNNGGSGGGGGDFGGVGGSGVFGQGNSGGSVSSNAECPGGGGGAGSAGTACTGGQGVFSAITGTTLQYASGGTANITLNYAAPNTGNGGASWGTPGGSSGVVIFAYQGTGKASGGTVNTTSRPGWTVHTFTSNGTFIVN